MRSPPATLRTAKQGPPTTLSSAGPRAKELAATAIPQLIELHGHRLYSLASRLCGNAADAEDMVQEVFLQAHRKWHTFKGDANPGTWLYAIAAHSCKARLRRKGGIDRRMPAVSQLMPWNETRNIELDGIPGGGSNGDGHGPVANAIERESARAVHEAIGTLPEHFCVPLVLKEMLELSIEDVAGALHIKPETVKTRVHRARLLLRKAIMDRRSVPTRADASLVINMLLQILPILFRLIWPKVFGLLASPFEGCEYQILLGLARFQIGFIVKILGKIFWFFGHVLLLTPILRRHAARVLIAPIRR